MLAILGSESQHNTKRQNLETKPGGNQWSVCILLGSEGKSRSE